MEQPEKKNISISIVVPVYNRPDETDALLGSIARQAENGLDYEVIIVEDVMTSGKALREILPKLRAAADVEVVGMVISVDRMEKGLESDLSAVQEAYEEFGVRVYSIVTMSDIISAIENGVIEGREYLAAMYAYRKTYGVD